MVIIKSYNLLRSIPIEDPRHAVEVRPLLRPSRPPTAALAHLGHVEGDASAADHILAMVMVGAARGAALGRRALWVVPGAVVAARTAVALADVPGWRPDGSRRPWRCRVVAAIVAMPMATRWG